MNDLKHCRYIEPVPFEVKLVHGIEFIAVFIAIVVGILYLSELV